MGTDTWRSTRRAVRSQVSDMTDPKTKDEHPRRPPAPARPLAPAPAVMGAYLHGSLGYGNLFVLAWFVASAATVGGGLGSGPESDEAIRAAAYSKREEDRRDRLEQPRRQAIRRVKRPTNTLGSSQHRLRTTSGSR